MRLTVLILLILSVFTLTACSSGAGNTVIVAGSTSVQPYAEVLAENYSIIFPDRAVDIQGGGSSTGIRAAQSGTADIGMSSRELTEEEQEMWNIVIAKDGLVLIVHPQNPVNGLTLEQVRRIYTGDVTNWLEVGGADRRIHVITREEGSGTRGAFEDMLMENNLITSRAIVQNTNGSVRQLVSNDIDSIGFLSLGLADQSVKALELDGVAPTWNNVMLGDYTLFRQFYFVSAEKPSDYVKLFIDFALSEEGQRLLMLEGLITDMKEAE
ncbi:MAG: phosphate ABC transporter substrate-binding protein [Oscillospiraceae bacterium]|nr:phosphate ABC transporter substrate-binding protein [Oscillospiraceae bacterium]